MASLSQAFGLGWWNEPFRLGGPATSPYRVGLYPRSGPKKPVPDVLSGVGVEKIPTLACGFAWAGGIPTLALARPRPVSTQPPPDRQSLLAPLSRSPSTFRLSLSAFRPPYSLAAS